MCASLKEALYNYNVMKEDILKSGGREFKSRLFMGTGKFSSNQLMLDSIVASGSEMITVAMKRIDMENQAEDDMLNHINREYVQFLPNTSGVRDAEEAILAAKLSRHAQVNFGDVRHDDELRVIEPCADQIAQPDGAAADDGNDFCAHG